MVETLVDQVRLPGFCEPLVQGDVELCKQRGCKSNIMIFRCHTHADILCQPRDDTPVQLWAEILSEPANAKFCLPLLHIDHCCEDD